MYCQGAASASQRFIKTLQHQANNLQILIIPWKLHAWPAWLVLTTTAKPPPAPGVLLHSPDILRAPVQALLHAHKALGLFVDADHAGNHLLRPMSAPQMSAAARCVRFLDLPKGLAQPSVYQRYWVRYAVMGATTIWGCQFLFR